MTEFNIDQYLNSLPDDINTINLGFTKLTYLPDLSRFKNLQILSCNFNYLTSLPVLPENLKEIYCDFNQLISLPVLPKNLRILYCNHNNLRSLPVLPENLKYLSCINNQLTSLPILNKNLKEFCYYKNPVCDIVNFNDFEKNIETLYNFRYLYYCLKYKKRFLKLMEPIIKKRYHPSYLDNLTEDDDLDEILKKW